MAQHDYVIANQTFPSYRNDHNNSLSAIVSNNSGATAPSTTYAYMWWYDTTTNILKVRNADDDAWISFATFDQVNDTVNFLDSSFSQLTEDLASNGFDINFADSRGVIIIGKDVQLGIFTLIEQFKAQNFDLVYFVSICLHSLNCS